MIIINYTHLIGCRNEDIRDAMLSLVHMVRTGEDKLERHEYRERQLGEQLKKLLTGLDKRHRSLDPMKGTLSRLDERLANVETILIQVNLHINKYATSDNFNVNYILER